jgi:DNA mismatch repair protein MutL
VRGAVEQALAGRGWLRERPGVSAGPATRVAEPGAGDWIFAATESRPGTEPTAAASAQFALGDPAPAEALRPLRFGDLHLLGQLLGTYLVLEEKGGLVLVDQHAAHERVLFERLRAAWLADGVERQALLLPAAVEMEPAAAEALAAGTALAVQLGFEVEPFGPASVVVRAVPALLADRDPAALVRDLAEELRAAQAVGGGLDASPRLLASSERWFATLACHSARRAGDVLDPREQRALLEALDTIPWAPTCPHGRPVAVPLSLAEIERRFGRR